MALEKYSKMNKSTTRWDSGDKIQHFTILNFIASDPLGDNYLAKDTQLNRLVAIKKFAFNVDLGFSVELVNRLKKKFIDDVKLFSKWDHPNLVAIHYFDVDDSGTPYYVMEYVPKTLSQWIGLSGNDPDEELSSKTESKSEHESIDIILGICKGLEIMHKGGVYHYRISPNNILITDEGIPKLVGFGIETGMRSDVASKIQQRYVGIYSAPEQIRGEHNSVGPKSDMYTIGLLFYQLLTGILPTGIIHKKSFNSMGISEKIQAFLMNMLEQDPQKRPKDLREIISNLEDLKVNQKKQKTDNYKRIYIVSISLAIIFLGVFYGFKSQVSFNSKEILVQPYFTPMIPASIYENLEPLGKYIFWTDIQNLSSKEKKVELRAKFKGTQDEWNKLSISVKANSDTIIGLNPFMNILSEKHDLRFNRNYYIDWKLTEGGNNYIIENQKTRLIQEGSNRIVMLGLGTIDWEILKNVYSTHQNQVSPFSLIASWIIPRDTKEILSKTNDLYNSAVVGYQKSLFESYTQKKGLDYRDLIRYQVNLIYQVLQNEFNIVYDGGGIGQTINFPQETLKYKSANCIELSVLFSSVLLEAGIEPVIVIVPDHAFVGWQIWDKKNEYDFLETTVIGHRQYSFSDAVLMGNHLANDYGLREMTKNNFDHQVFDQRGVYQRSERVEVLHISTIRNFKDKEGRQVYTAVPVGYEVN